MPRSSTVAWVVGHERAAACQRSVASYQSLTEHGRDALVEPKQVGVSVVTPRTESRASASRSRSSR